jgi:hypothetical protein
LPLAPALVAAGMCVAMVSESMCRVQLERLTFVELVDDDDADLTYPIAFALRKGQSPNVWAVPFMEIAHEVMAKGSTAKPASDRGRRRRRDVAYCASSAVMIFASPKPCAHRYASTVRNSEVGARSLRHELIGWLVSA